MKKRIKDVLNNKALFLFFVVSIISFICYVFIVIKYKIVLYQALSLLMLLYCIFKTIYFEMTGVFDD